MRRPRPFLRKGGVLTILEVMRLIIKGTNLELTPELKSYTIDKLTSFERFFPETKPDAIIADIELARTTKHHQKGRVFRCEVNLTIGKALLRAEESGESITEAIDKVRDEIERQALNYVERRRSRFLRAARKFARRLKLTR